MKRNRIYFSGIALIFLLCVCINSTAGGVIIVPDNYATIQEAVDAAVPGDVIYVRAGVYGESIYIGKSLSIIAEGTGQEDKSVKINPTPEGHTPGFCIDSDNVTIEGFEIGFTDFGILFNHGNSYCRLNNNYIHDMKIAGIGLWDSDGGSNFNMISNNVIENIGIDGIIVHVPLDSVSYGINTGNTIVKNKIRNVGWGINIGHGENFTICDNRLEDIKGIAIAINNTKQGIESNNNTIAYNYIKGVTNGSGGIAIGRTFGSADHNNIHHNEIQDITNPQYWCAGIEIQGSYNLIHHNSVNNAGTPYEDWGVGNKFFKNIW